MNLHRIFILFTTLLIIMGFFIYIAFPERSLTISTTTSLYATGLLDYIQEKYGEVDPGLTIKIIPQGSGAALETAARGDADIVFAHAPNLEKEYIDRGVLKDGVIIAYNYFIVVGPKEDPAGIADAKNIEDVFRRIYQAGEEGRAKFVSRGDRSGTHVRELMLWDAAGLKPEGDWYIESGSGMGETLLLANQMGAYTLSDIGTYTIFSKKGKINELTKLFEKDDKLLNIYSIYLVNGRETEEAKRFYRYIVENISRLIREFNDREGATIFYPADTFEGDLQTLWKRFSTGEL